MKAASFVPTALLLATLLPGTLALTGCDDLLGSDDGDVTLTTDDRLYSPGDTVHIRLLNGTDHSVEHGSLCWIHFERRGPDGWVDAGLDPAFCPYPVYVLKPGESTEQALHLPPDIAAGEYRAGFHVSDGDRSIDVDTPVFRVEPATAELRRPDMLD